MLFQLDEEGDINLVRDYFSYNHFYVIWCLFWELDEDEDSLLHTDDLLRCGPYPHPNLALALALALARSPDAQS